MEFGQASEFSFELLFTKIACDVLRTYVQSRRYFWLGFQRDRKVVNDVLVLPWSLKRLPWQRTIPAPHSAG